MGLKCEIIEEINISKLTFMMKEMPKNQIDSYIYKPNIFKAQSIQQF